MKKELEQWRGAEKNAQQHIFSIIGNGPHYRKYNVIKATKEQKTNGGNIRAH